MWPPALRGSAASESTRACSFFRSSVKHGACARHLAAMDRLSETTCSRCGTRQTVPARETLRVLDLPSVRTALEGRPTAVLCEACGVVLLARTEIEVRGQQCTAVVKVDSASQRPQPHADSLAGSART